MNLSMRWLEDYVKLDVSPKQFADSMTMSGSKVEGWHVEGSDISRVVVGKIIAISRHPSADTLVVCTVDIGSKDLLSIVTGAKNLCRGDHVPVALDGAVLPGGQTISNTVLRGVESCGMLCSLSELGLSVHDFPYADENGIFVLDEPCVLGEPIQSALGFNDTVVEFEITSNRPDCLSVMGLAREAGATFKKPFVPSQPKVHKNNGDINTLLTVEVHNAALCPRYVAMAVTDVKIAPSPRWMRERLRASGVRPINNIVDITNFVMLEYGQPMHAFDIRHVSQGRIVVRNALAGENLVTLDGVSRSYNPRYAGDSRCGKAIGIGRDHGRRIFRYRRGHRNGDFRIGKLFRVRCACNLPQGGVAYRKFLPF
jgi:phenylalanyl-tRNA synthetase beta chain